MYEQKVEHHLRIFQGLLSGFGDPPEDVRLRRQFLHLGQAALFDTTPKALRERPPLRDPASEGAPELLLLRGDLQEPTTEDGKMS